MSRKFFASLVCLSLASVFALPSFAQDATEEAPAGDAPPALENAIVSGLNNPRGISYDADGNLWVSEAGLGGSTLLFSDPEMGDITVGLTSQVTSLSADGTQSVALAGLFSGGSPETEVTGLTGVWKQGDSVWLAFSGGGPAPSTFYADAVVEIDAATLRIKTWIDLYGYEVANNPDGADPLDSNVNDLAWSPDGTLFIMDTGANALFTWTAEGGLSPFHVWPDNPVPTSMAFDANGDLYVGFLGAGLAPGAAKIEHWSADGSTLVETFEGLTTITDIAIGADGNVYAVSLIQFGEQGPVFNSGSVIMVNADGATPVAENLPQPYSLAQAPDGSWAVSVGSTFGPPGSGAVLSIGGE